MMGTRNDAKNYIPGQRRYGAWSGDPEGRPERTDVCFEEVWDKGMYHFRQCTRPRGFGYKGLFCKQHARHYADLENEQ